MKTKTIPFDLEMAKKIQAGEVEGKIETRDGDSVRIICWDRKISSLSIVALVGSHENVVLYRANGRFRDEGNSHLDIVLEVPDNEPQFKPFDKVLVRDKDDCRWRCCFFSHLSDGYEFPYISIIGGWKQCIPYEGNEELVGTTKKPKEK